MANNDLNIRDEIKHLVPKSFFEGLEDVSFGDTESNISLGWFVPFLPIQDRIYSEMFLKEWVLYGHISNHYNNKWESLLEYLLDCADVKHSEHHGRVVASVFAWMGTSVGLCDISILAEKLKANRNTRSDPSNEKIVLSFWPEYSSKTRNHNYAVGTQLARLLHKDRKDVTCDELNLAQSIFLLFSNYEGLDFLLKTLSKIKKHQNEEKLRQLT